MNSLCTITTSSHLAHTLALRDSVMAYNNDIHYNVLVIDNDNADKLKHEKTSFFSLKSIEKAYLANAIIKKYKNNKDKLRWCLKPVFLHFLIEQQKFAKLVYVDNDVFFFSNYDFLFDELDNKDVLLCPHWRCSDPLKNKDWFLVNFTDGLYNAGFFAANQNALKALEWWAKACHFKCAKVMRKGMFDDQKYLDVMPIIFENTGILKHRGCNVAYWNQIENKRTLINNSVLINSTWSIVFIHFTKELIKSIKNNKDPLLKEHLNTYQQKLKQFADINL